ncbi:MAG TPA: hypothetical protein VJH88_04980 [Candidatus Nanoarchaeia archaeon]|nr:hypothetical protein [Candidatus Nanoarchaeia archaeon]
MLPEGLTLPIIIGAAVLDSINPCVFGVLIFLIAFMTKAFKDPRKMLAGSLVYTAVVYLTYFFIGIGILKFTVSFGFSVAIYWVASLIAIFAGILEIKDFFFYGKGLSLRMSKGASERVKRYTAAFVRAYKKNQILGYVAAILLGGFVVLVELPCTGAPYLAILAILSKGDFSQGIPLLLLYNFIFILPLFIIIGAAYFGKSSKRMEELRKKHRGLMRLAMGLFLIGLGLFMLYSIW